MTVKEAARAACFPKRSTVFDRSADLIIALFPAATAGCVFFGMRALFMLLCTVFAAVAAEFSFGKIAKVPVRIGNLASAAAGLIVGMSVPAGFSIPAAMCCSATAVFLAVTVFGGASREPVPAGILGALLARAVYSPRFIFEEAFTHTPANGDLSLVSGLRLLFGAHAGAIGEVGVLFLCAGAVYLFVRRVASPVFIAAGLLSAAAAAAIFKTSVSLSLAGGGLLLGLLVFGASACAPRGLLANLACGLFCGAFSSAVTRFCGVDGVYAVLILAAALKPLFSKLPRFGFEEVFRDENA